MNCIERYKESVLKDADRPTFAKKVPGKVREKVWNDRDKCLSSVQKIVELRIRITHKNSYSFSFESHKKSLG